MTGLVLLYTVLLMIIISTNVLSVMTSLFYIVADHSLPAYNKIVATVPPVSGTPPKEAISHLAIDVIFEGGMIVETGSFFDYRPNPNVTGIWPVDHLLRYNVNRH